jgi:hypothetical protein
MKRSTPQTVAAFFAGVVLATGMGATAAAPSKNVPSMKSRLTRLEIRHNQLEWRYRDLCNALRYGPQASIRDTQVREVFYRLAAVC